MPSFSKSRKQLFFSKYFSLIIMNVVLISLLFILVQLKPIDHIKEYRIGRTNGDQKLRIYGDVRVSQEFYCEDEFDSFELKISAANSNYHGLFHVRLLDEQGNIIET